MNYIFYSEWQAVVIQIAIISGEFFQSINWLLPFGNHVRCSVSNFAIEKSIFVLLLNQCFANYAHNQVWVVHLSFRLYITPPEINQKKLNRITGPF